MSARAPEVALRLRAALGPCARRFCVVLALSLFALPAAAHPDLDRAVRLSAELDFQLALRSFERALDSGTLTRDELITLLAERALLLHALRRKDDVEKDFVWLAAIAPSYQLDARAPPDLTAVWDAVRSREGGPTRVELLLERHAGRVRLRPVLAGPHPPGLTVAVYYRGGGVPYQQSLGTQPVEPMVSEDSAVEAYAELRGPGQVVFARTGAEQQPLVLQVAEAGVGIAAANGEPARDQPKRSKWLWIGSVAAVVVVGVVAGAIIATKGGEDEGDKTRLMPVASF